MPNAHTVFDRPIAYHRIFVSLTGSVTAAVMLSQAVYWQRRAGGMGGNFWKTQEDWEDETGLTRSEQETARRKLRENLPTAWFEERAGTPARLFFRVDLAELERLAIKNAGIPQSCVQESCNQVGGNPAISLTETTSETTTENKDPQPAASETSYDGFEDAWSIYPRKVGKGAAEKSWHKLKPSKKLSSEIYQAIVAQSAPGAQLDLRTRISNAGECFVPHFATWLNQKRWKDAVEKIKGAETEAQRRNREWIEKAKSGEI